MSELPSPSESPSQHQIESSLVPYSIIYDLNINEYIEYCNFHTSEALPRIAESVDNVLIIGGSPYNHVFYQRSLKRGDVIALLPDKYDMNDPFAIGSLVCIDFTKNLITICWYKRNIITHRYTLTTNVDNYTIEELNIQVFGTLQEMFHHDLRLKSHIEDRLNEILEG